MLSKSEYQDLAKQLIELSKTKKWSVTDELLQVQVGNKMVSVGPFVTAYVEELYNSEQDKFRKVFYWKDHMADMHCLFVEADNVDSWGEMILFGEPLVDFRVAKDSYRTNTVVKELK